MNINVPEFARNHFWEEPPPGSEEFWACRFPSPCRVDEELLFHIDGRRVDKVLSYKPKPKTKKAKETKGKEPNRD